jgi:hypothetical protein
LKSSFPPPPPATEEEFDCGTWGNGFSEFGRGDVKKLSRDLGDNRCRSFESN